MFVSILNIFTLWSPSDNYIICWILVHWPLLMFGFEGGEEGMGFHFK